MLEPGVEVIVGCHSVKVVRFLSEGGYSQIYEVQMLHRGSEGDNSSSFDSSKSPSQSLSQSPPHPQTQPQSQSQSVSRFSSQSKSLPSSRVACLKHVKVADKAGLAELRKEVDVMRTLENARNIVKYFDSHAERLPDGSYQVLVLMELCPNGSLLDYMNARIREKLTESQILTIMMDVAVGVYEMHRLHLLHRDIKIENVLIDAKHRYKLGDFGSVSKPIQPPKDQQEFQLLSHDILYHTTPQYRAPEMLDLTCGVPIDCKSDIWAIGCFLYKLCYYTTPFEAAGDIAILHASFQFPPSPLYSGDLKNLIIIMLQQDLRFRPNIVQILMLLARMCNQDFNKMGIEDYTNTGPYDFNALYEMQREKQQQLLQQQQHHAQQHQQYYYEQQKKRLLSALITQHGTSTGPRVSSASPLYARLPDVYLPNDFESCAVDTITAAADAVPQPVARTSAQIDPEVPLTNPHHMLNKNEQVLRSRPPSVIDLYSENPSAALYSYPNLQSVQSQQISTNTPEPEQSVTDDIELLELAYLDDIENRYPTLDALDQAVQPTHNVEPTLLDAERTSRSTHQKKFSDFENVEAWEKPSGKAFDEDAEKLVNDIFGASSVNVNATKSASTDVAPQQAVPRKPLDISRSRGLSTGVHDEFVQLASRHSLEGTRTMASNELEAEVDLSSVGVTLPPYYPKVEKIPSPVAQAVQPKVAVLPQALLQPVSRTASRNQQYHLQQQSYLGEIKSSYLSSAKPSAGSSNPWGDALTPKMEPKSAFSGSGKIPDIDLSTQMLNLGHEEAISPLEMPLKRKVMDMNLIELEVGLLSFSSLNINNVPPKLHETYLEEASLIGIDSESYLAKGRTDENTRPFKMAYPDLRDQKLQEEVIDFASDDENCSSDLSRVAIRQSLKKTRKTADHKRSDSAGGERRKRHSFFGS